MRTLLVGGVRWHHARHGSMPKQARMHSMATLPVDIEERETNEARQI